MMLWEVARHLIAGVMVACGGTLFLSYGCDVLWSDD